MAKSGLEKNGYEILPFAGMGVGGRAQEDYIRENPVAGVIELGIYEIGGELLGAAARSGPNRMEAAGKKGVPQLVTPGNADFVAFLGMETVPDRFKNRHIHAHNPQATLMRTSADEMKLIAETVAHKLNQATGPVKVLIPTRGFSDLDKEGAMYYDPDSDKVFIDTLKSKLNPLIPVLEIDAHINDPLFVEAVVENFLQIVKEAG